VLATARSRNPALWWVVGGALIFLGLVLYVPFLRELFLFAKLDWDDIALCLAAGSASVLWFEVFKIIGRRRN
jgi:P-type Ca2+ transporter type 2C